MSYKPGDNVTVEFCTQTPNGQSTNADSIPEGTINCNGVDDHDVIVTVTNLDTGRYVAAFVIPATYAHGDSVNLSIAATVNLTSGKNVIWCTKLREKLRPLPPSEVGETDEIVGDIAVIRAGIPRIDECPILTRMNAYVVSQGVPNLLEHTFRDRQGNPVDLSTHLDYPVSEQSAVSLSISVPAARHSRVLVRVKEWLGEGASSVTNPIFDMYGQGRDPAYGTVQVRLDTKVVALPGIYEMSWAIVDPRGTPLLVNQSLLSVERSLFYAKRDAAEMFKNQGPPTLQEIRMWMMDSSRNENLLLDDVEFGDEQILLALSAPVRHWNEIPPPIEVYTTRNFPYRGAWISGVLAKLHTMAANHYRRNRLVHQAGGTTIDDLNREREYLAEGQRLWKEYTDWCQNKKVACNIQKFAGMNSSPYSYRTGW